MRTFTTSRQGYLLITLKKGLGRLIHHAAYWKSVCSLWNCGNQNFGKSCLVKGVSLLGYGDPFVLAGMLSSHMQWHAWLGMESSARYNVKSRNRCLENSKWQWSGFAILMGTTHVLLWENSSFLGRATDEQVELIKMDCQLWFSFSCTMARYP